MLKRARMCDERRISSALAVLCLVAFVSIAPAAKGQVVDATQWHSGTVTVTEGWREHDGDNLQWAQPAFDDSGWRTVELDDMGAAQPGYRWYRLHLKLAKERPHEHLLIVGGDGVYELYVNGLREPDIDLRSMFSVKRPTEQIIMPARRGRRFHPGIAHASPAVLHHLEASAFSNRGGGLCGRDRRYAGDV